MGSGAPWGWRSWTALGNRLLGALGDGEKEERTDPGISIRPANTPTPIRSLGAQKKWDLVALGGLSSI